MITALDTNILIDIVTASNVASREAVRRAHAEGGLVLGEVVYSELCAVRSRQEVDEILARLGVTFVASSPDALARAGALWTRHLRSGGKRTRILSDFMIGAHALHHADRLCTRDRGFFRKYFRELQLLEP